MNRLFFFLLLLLCLVGRHPAAATSLPDGVPEARLVGERVEYSYVANASQLFVDTWLPGKVVFEGGQTKGVAGLVYNGFHDEVVCLTASNEYLRLEKAGLKGFVLEDTIGKQTLVFEKIQVPSTGTGLPAWIYAQVLYKGSLSVYAFRNIQAGRREIVYQQERAFEQRRYKPDHSYLIQLSDGSWHSFGRLRAKSLQNAFPQKKNQIRSIRREHQIRLRNNEQELVRLIRLVEPILNGSSH